MTRFIALSLPVLLAACAVQGTDFPEVGFASAASDQAPPDTCGASAYEYLVGAPRSALDTVDLPDGTRVLLPGDAATMDMRPERLNILIDGNAEVARVSCG